MSIWLVWLVMLGGVITVLQAPLVYRVLFDPFSLLQDLLSRSEVDVGGRQVAQALMITMMVAAGDEPTDAAFEIA